MKYGTRERLKEAWTFEGKCALGEEEDPEKGTVQGTAGNFYQPECDPLGKWEENESPARYADFMEFGITMNRNFLSGYERLSSFPWSKSSDRDKQSGCRCSWSIWPYRRGFYGK